MFLRLVDLRRFLPLTYMMTILSGCSPENSAFAPATLNKRTSAAQNDTYFEGTFRSFYADSFDENGSQKINLITRSSDHKNYRLKTTSEAQARKLDELRTDTPIRIHGKQIGDEIILDAVDPASIIAKNHTLALSDPIVSGTKNIAVILVNFSDKQNAADSTTLNGMLFTNTSSMNAFYQESSFGLVSVQGQIYGPVNINYTSTSCSITDILNWADAADAAATATNIPWNNYTHRIFVFPTPTNCGYAGFGDIGGSSTRAWVFNWNKQQVYEHEFGHNLGNHHASVPGSEYGDTSDIMACCNNVQFNAPHKMQMGWLPAASIVDISPRNATFTIANSETDPAMVSYPQVVRIARAANSDYLYFSYRKKIGFDVNLNNAYANTLQIHSHNGTSVQTMLQGFIGDGQTFSDSVSGMVISQVSHTADTATFEIQAPNSCTKGTQNIAMAPSITYNLPGASQAYTLSVKNNDDLNCNATKYMISCVSNEGLVDLNYNTALSLEPSQAANVTINAWSYATTPQNDYPLICYVTDNTSNVTVNTSAIYRIDLQKPSAPVLSATTATGKSIRISWVPSTDSSGVAKYRIFRNGTLLAETILTSFTDSAVSPRKIYTYQVTAVDVVGNESPASNSVMTMTNSKR